MSSPPAPPSTPARGPSAGPAASRSGPSRWRSCAPGGERLAIRGRVHRMGSPDRRRQRGDTVQIEIVGRGFEVDEETRESVRKRFDRVGRQVSEHSRLEVVLREESQSRNRRQVRRRGDPAAEAGDPPRGGALGEDGSLDQRGLPRHSPPGQAPPRVASQAHGDEAPSPHGSATARPEATGPNRPGPARPGANRPFGTLTPWHGA